MGALKRLVKVRTAVAAAALVVLTVGTVVGEERKFAVMLAHSPKSFETNGQPGVPSGGLPDVTAIDREYFSRNPVDAIGSFAEYWDEITYGDIHITGRAFGWVTLPWAFSPDPPNAAARPSPENFINLRRGAMQSEGIEVTPFIPGPYGYGAGEDFCDCFHDQTGVFCFSSGDASAAISSGDCGGLIITDLVGSRRNVPPPMRGPGMNDFPAVGIDVWTPGERFLDLDNDNRWDAIDEFNDQLCHGPDGCREKQCSISHRPCVSNLHCPTGETCMGPDPVGSGPRGCNSPSCGNLSMAWINWDGDVDADNCGNCVIPVMPPCRNNGDCERFPGATAGVCDTELGRCLPANCITPSLLTQCSPQLSPCCTGGENDPDDCVENGVEGLNCGQPPIMCCEFDDSTDENRQANASEPFEDYMVRWNPLGGGPASVWEPVDENYVRTNYPGDIEKLVKRTGNGYYDPPDVFLDFRPNATEISTKMMQDAGSNQHAWRVPKPGTFPAYTQNEQVDEQPWFDQFWRDRYGTQPPAWPGYDAGVPVFVPFNSPRMRPFDPNEPNPPVVRGEAGRRWFQPNRGGRDGHGNGTREDPNLILSPGLDDPPGTILPEEVYGYYDGWVEHDDLPSSKYHFQGDKRLGEITSPSTDTVSLPSPAANDGTYTAIFGVDLGLHNPNAPQAIRDQIVPAAGPYAVKIHGEKGFDAGDVCILEWLTWRAHVEDEDNDNTIDENEHHRTIGHQWAWDNGFYHPFAGPATPRSQGPIGFKDYNLDGMIDQGEVRPERSENYSVDVDPFSTNDGTASSYPFNRRRMVEDIVEALDPTVDWDDFIDPNSMNANLCTGSGQHLGRTFVFGNLLVAFDPKDYLDLSTGEGDPDLEKFIQAQGYVSGIVIAPPNAWTNDNRFPTAPSFYPIHNEDNNSSQFMIPDYPVDPFAAAEIHQSFNLFFHDLVICADCRSPAPAVTPYAAHEYLHSWQGFPDLYDYDVFRDPPSDDINCPVGAWDIMERRGLLVHPAPILKEGRCTHWIDPVDLTTVLTPGVETSLTLPPAELVRDNSYFFLENEQRLGERYYFWSAGSGFDSRMPGSGMLVMYTNVGANPEALPLQQTTQPFNYRIVQADGLGQLEACSSTGNVGDEGDPWPGSSNATQFNFSTNPPAIWNTLNTWTGLDISDVEEDGSGSVRLTLTWVPTNIPSLRFIDPPGGVSVSNLYRVQFEATDVFGGTTLRLFYMPDRQTCSGSGAVCIRNADCPSGQFCRYDVTVSPTNAKFIAERRKTSPGTDQLSTDWNITGVADGRYVLFAKLIPGQGADGLEVAFTTPRAGRNNLGDGMLSVNSVSLDNDASENDDTARLETWTAVCIDAANGGTWRVNSTLTQPIINAADPNSDPYPKAQTGQLYRAVGDAVTFTIAALGVPFAVDDSFTFTTTGITAASRTVTITNGRISEDPTAVIVAGPLAGDPPLTVNFDARSSVEPNNAPLSFSWNFGDGAQASGPLAQHTYTEPGTFTAVLRATNPANGRFGEAQVDIDVTNNSPHAAISAVPTSGPSPLQVAFTGAQSSDLETSPSDLIYQWDFGDGVTANNQGQPGTAFQSTSHTYRNRANGTPCSPTNPCDFTATLTVTDEGGKLDTDTVQIRVGNSDPVPIVTHTSLEGASPFTVIFNAKTSTDAEGQPLTVVWDWDDGTANETYPASTGKPPAIDGSVPHTFTLPVGTTSRTYRVTATVRDNVGGESRWAGVTVTVTAAVPQASDPRAIFTLNPDPPVFNQPFTADGTLSFDRPVGVGRITEYTWSWGDGTASSTGSRVTHTYARAGSFTLTLTVRDDENRTNSLSRTILIQAPGGGTGDGENQPPVASLVVTPGRGFAGVTAFTFNASGSTDPDGDRTRLVYTWSFGDGSSANGSVVTHIYQAPNPTGYLVRLQVRDEDNATTEATHTVMVDDPTGNRPPVAAIATGVRRGTAPLSLSFDGRNSFDPDGDELSFRWEFKNADGALIDTLIGATVTRTFNSTGSFSVELVVSDNRGLDDRAGPQTIEVTASIAPPEPTPPRPEPDDNEPPNSANQRPTSTLCGLGALLGMIGSFSGLCLVKIRRRRF